MERGREGEVGMDEGKDGGRREARRREKIWKGERGRE